MSSHRPSLNCSASASTDEVAPARSAPTVRPIPAKTSSGRATAASGTNMVPAAKRSWSRSAAATASRVLPTPPGPVSVTSRAWPRSISATTSSMACSLPISDVVPTGSAEAARELARGAVTGDGVAAAANRSLNSTARSSRTNLPSSAGVPNLRYEASCLIRPMRLARRGSRSGAGALTYSKRGNVFERSNSSSRPDTCRPGTISP
jgi:hypothetical protein